MRKLIAFVITVLAHGHLGAQFTPGILANDSYWADGKAEFNIYDAQLMRGGELRHCEVIHIFLRERIDPKTFARVDDVKRTDAITVIRMQQIWSAPIGMFIEQGSIGAYWRLDPVSLARLHFVGTNSLGNVTRRVEQTSSGSSLAFEGYLDGSVSAPLAPPPNAVFYDELPLRVRTIDFRKAPGEFEMELAPSLSSFTRREALPFETAKISWKPSDKSTEVTVQHAGGSDRFILDREFPFLLREWNAADGSKLKMKRGLKADYWNYSKNGDRERALKNPMLEHPD